MITNVIHNMDCLAGLRTLPSDSVDCGVTSPPYYGLRSYLPEGHADKHLEIGLEETPEQYIGRMVAVFREFRRVLKPQGTLWLNIGDSYAEASKNRTEEQACRKSKLSGSLTGQIACKNQINKLGNGFKPKDLMGIPWALATALRAGFSTCTGCQCDRRSDLWPVYDGRRVCIDCLLAGRGDHQIRQTEPGWYLRSDIIWHKPAPMPESVTDRPTKSHEYLFLLAKSQTYYYDHEAIKEPVTDSTIARLAQNLEMQTGSDRVPGKTNGSMKAVGGGRPQRQRAAELFQQANLTQAHLDAMRAVGLSDTGQNKLLQTGSGKNTPEVIRLADEAKQALGGYYRELLSAGRKAGNKTHKYVTQYEGSDSEEHRTKAGLLNLAGVEFQTRNKRSVWTVQTSKFGEAHFATFPPELIIPCIKAGCPPGGIVVDPFAGAGTTPIVAEKLGRRWIAYELNAEYVALANRRRTDELGPLTFLTPAYE